MNNTIFGENTFFFPPKKFSHNNFNITIYCISSLGFIFIYFFRDVLDIYLFHLFNNVTPETKKKIIRNEEIFLLERLMFFYLFDSVISETKKFSIGKVRFRTYLIKCDSGN